MKIKEFNAKITKHHENIIIPFESYENHENHRIPLENFENHENHKITHKNYENHENHSSNGESGKSKIS